MPRLDNFGSLMERIDNGDARSAQDDDNRRESDYHQSVCDDSVTDTTYSNSATNCESTICVNPRNNFITPLNDVEDEDNYNKRVKNGYFNSVQDSPGSCSRLNCSHGGDSTQKALLNSSSNIINSHSMSRNHRKSQNHHDLNSSDSSDEARYNARFDAMMVSPPSASRKNSYREKQRKRSRSSFLRPNGDGSGSSSCESPLRSRQLEDKTLANSSRNPIAVRRRSSKQSGSGSSHKRRSSSHSSSRTLLIESSFEECISENRNHLDFGKDMNVEYSSPEFSSGSSPDSSPSRLVADMHRLQQQQQQQQQLSSQETRASTKLSSSSKCGCDSPSEDSYIGTSGYGNPLSSTLTSNSSTGTVPQSTKFNYIKTATNVKSLCLSGTFLSMVILSLSGMILMTNRAVFPAIAVNEIEKEFVPAIYNRPEKIYSAAGLRGKLVLGRMWDNSKKISDDSHSGDARTGGKNYISSKKKKNLPIKHPNLSTGNGDFSKQHVESQKKMTTAPSHRLQLHVPPQISYLESTFETIDPNLYQPSSISQNSNKNSGNSPGSLPQKNSHHPRILLLDPSVKRVTRKVKLYPADFTDNTQLYGTLSSDDERLSLMEMRSPYSEGECVPMQKWQTTFHPTCNAMHEQALQTIGFNHTHHVNNKRKPEGLDAILFGTGGFWRYAWKMVLHNVDFQQDKTDTVVLKTLKYEHNFEDAHFEHDRVDAVAMERLTSSPHVINIFGFCGHSVVTEYADGSRLGALADKSRKTSLERLRIARDIANGLADVHGIDGDGNATFVHLDVNPANVVSVNGTLKLNDFNIGIIRQWNTTSNEACGFPTQYPNPQWRSPEEALNEKHLTEKVDIFSLGHIFFRLICGHEPWNKLEPGGRPSKEEVGDKVQRGVLPYIPDHVRDSTDPEVITIRDVMIECYKFDPTERPSARDIAKTFDNALKSMKSKRGKEMNDKKAK